MSMNANKYAPGDLLQYQRSIHFPPRLESDFRKDYASRAIVMQRFFIASGLFIYGVFGILDYYAMPRTHEIAWSLRILLAPFAILLFMLSFKERFHGWMYLLSNLWMFGVNLTWVDSDGNEQGFKIERCAGAGCSDFAQIATVGANVTSYSNTGLTASTSYSYRVRAYNAVGDSDYSNTASAVTLDAPAIPAAPSGLVATVVSKSQINLSWTDNATNETGYRIERCKGATCTNFALVATVGANVTTYSNTKLNASTTYRYRVYAYNASGNSDYSNIAAATTPRR